MSAWMILAVLNACSALGCLSYALRLRKCNDHNMGEVVRLSRALAKEKTRADFSANHQRVLEHRNECLEHRLGELRQCFDIQCEHVANAMCALPCPPITITREQAENIGGGGKYETKK